jgi:hypothetical protein
MRSNVPHDIVKQWIIGNPPDGRVLLLNTAEGGAAGGFEDWFADNELADNLVLNTTNCGDDMGIASCTMGS